MRPISRVRASPVANRPQQAWRLRVLRLRVPEAVDRVERHRLGEAITVEIEEVRLQAPALVTVVVHCLRAPPHACVVDADAPTTEVMAGRDELAKLIAQRSVDLSSVRRSI